MFARFFTSVNQFPKTILLVILALSAFFFVQAKNGLFDPHTGRLRINSTVEPFIERDSGAYQQFLEARAAFGSEEVVVIALHNKDKKPIDFKYLLTLAHLKAEIEEIVPGVSKVLSMLNLPQASGACAGKSYFHQIGVGTVCVSIIEEYEQNISCLKSSVANSTSQQESDDSFEDSLEEGLEDSLDGNIENNLDENLEGSLEENLEENPDDSVDNSVNSKAVNDSVLDCSLTKSNEDPESLMLEADLKISKIIKGLKNHPLFEGDLLSRDLSTAALILTFSPDSKPESDNTQSILHKLLAKYQQESEIAETLQIAYAGQPRQINEASRLIRQDMELILPLSLMLIVVVLLLAFRSMQAVIVPLAVVLFGILWTAGIIGLIGDELNLVTMACAPIIVCVGSAYVIKFLNQYQTESLQIREKMNAGESKHATAEVISATLTSVSVPVTVTAITTVAGFIALVVSPIPAVQQLGLYSSVGIVAINLFTLTLAPALLNYIKMPDLKPVEKSSGILNRFFQIIVEWLRLHSKRLIWIWLVVAAFATYGMLDLTINSSTKTFPEESQLVRDLEFIENELAGTDTLRLLFKAGTDSELEQESSSNPLLTVRTIYGLRELQNWLFQHGGSTEVGEIEGLIIDKIHSPVDVLDHYRQGLEKLTDEEVVQFFAKAGENGPKFLNDAEDVMQVTLRMRSSGSTSFLALRDLLLDKVPELLPHLQFSYTGGGVLSSESANNIAQGQINSVFLALIIVFAILSMLFLSWKMGVIALFPNVITILIFFGSLGWLDIPIGVTISVIAAIALGIGVDDTIHFLSHYNEYANKLRNKRKASLKTLPIVGRPMLFSTIALSAGFILFAQSEMESQVLFGTFTAFTLIVCLAIDMTFLPSVVMETGLITVWDYVGLKFDEKFIQGIDLFQGMTVREAKIASLMAYTVDLEKGTLLFKEGDIGDEMYVILNGTIAIFLEKDGKRTDLVCLENGNTFGEMGLFRQAERSASAEATEKTRLLVLNRDCLEPLKKRNPKIAAKLFMNLAHRLQLSLKNTNERLLAQKNFNLASLESKLKQEEKLVQEEQSVNLAELWAELGEKWRRKIKSYSEELSLSSGKKLNKIRPETGGYLFITSGEVVIEPNVSAKNKTFSVGYCWTRKGFDLIGEFVLCTAEATSVARAIAKKDSTLMLFKETQLLKLVEQEPRISAQFFEDLVCLLSDQLAIADIRLQGH
ncbi:MAG: MMPL family transporter [SAR324 cluster bacterium]|nr:MMPL family transporter [SAR324 cluster bacterium]MBL7035831.1 MMPL family transporter [SAR324 cluster bacterium]